MKKGNGKGVRCFLSFFCLFIFCDEERGWKRCEGKMQINSTWLALSFGFFLLCNCCLFVCLYFCLFVGCTYLLQVQGEGIQPGLFCQLHLASSSWTRVQGLSRRGMWRSWTVRVFHLKMKRQSFSSQNEPSEFFISKWNIRVISSRFNPFGGKVVGNFVNYFSF